MKFSNWKEAEQSIKFAENTIFANQTVEEYYSTKTWHLEEKKNSQVMGIILKYGTLFNQYGISIDNVIKTLCSIYNFGHNQKSYFALPDKFVTFRTCMSRNKTHQVVNILSKTDILDIKYSGNTILIKLNNRILEYDDYFQKKADKFSNQDEKILAYCKSKYGYISYYPYARKTVVSHWKKSILGITLAYNDLMDEYIESKNNNPYAVKYNNRADIRYIEIPINIICRVLKVSETKVMTYIYKLAKFSNYISKHDKVYIDTNTIQHYYNEEYRKCDLAKTYKTELEVGHPEVTKYSYILHKPEFNETKIGKYVNDNIEEYKEIVRRELLFIDIDKFNDTFKNFEDETDNSNENDNIDNYYNDNFNLHHRDLSLSDDAKSALDEYFDEDFKCGSIIDFDKIHQKPISVEQYKKIKLVVNAKKISKLSFENTCKQIKKIIENFPDNRKKDLSYLIRVLKDTVKRLYEWLDIHSSPTLDNFAKKMIDMYELHYFVSNRYEFIS